jgi:hypothetical protein
MTGDEDEEDDDAPKPRHVSVGRGKELKKETGFDKVPDSRRGKLICMIASKHLGRPFDELYRRTPYGQVLEELALAIAAVYTPPPDN